MIIKILAVLFVFFCCLVLLSELFCLIFIDWGYTPLLTRLIIFTKENISNLITTAFIYLLECSEKVKRFQ